MICKEIEKYCKCYNLIENYDKAVADETQMWDLHHRAETDENYSKKQLKEQGRYFGVEPSELIFLTRSEHVQLHYDSELGKDSKRKISEAHKGEKHPNYGKQMSEEQKRKISDSLTGEKNPRYGKHCSEETKRKISEANSGRVLSDETKRKLSESRTGEKNHNYGKQMSEEAKRKMSDSHKGKSLSDSHRRKLSEVRKGRHWKLVDGKRVYY